MATLKDALSSDFEWLFEAAPWNGQVQLPDRSMNVKELRGVCFMLICFSDKDGVLRMPKGYYDAQVLGTKCGINKTQMSSVLAWMRLHRLVKAERSGRGGRFGHTMIRLDRATVDRDVAFTAPSKGSEVSTTPWKVDQAEVSTKTAEVSTKTVEVSTKQEWRDQYQSTESESSLRELSQSDVAIYPGTYPREAGGGTTASPSGAPPSRVEIVLGPSLCHNAAVKVKVGRVNRVAVCEECGIFVQELHGEPFTPAPDLGDGRVLSGVGGHALGAPEEGLAEMVPENTVEDGPRPVHAPLGAPSSATAERDWGSAPVKPITCEPMGEDELWEPHMTFSRHNACPRCRGGLQCYSEQGGIRTCKDCRARYRVEPGPRYVPIREPAHLEPMQDLDDDDEEDAACT